MDAAKFIEEVRRRADIPTSEEARKAVTAVLETLGERIYRTDRDHLGAMLPYELKACLRKRDVYDKFTLEDFFTRVSARADVGYPHAVELSHTVASVLLEATSRGQVDHLLTSLPSEYRDLFPGIDTGTPESYSI